MHLCDVVYGSLVLLAPEMRNLEITGLGSYEKGIASLLANTVKPSMTTKKPEHTKKEDAYKVTQERYLS